jgi:hypothetical protein
MSRPASALHVNEIAARRRHHSRTQPQIAKLS